MVLCNTKKYNKGSLPPQGGRGLFDPEWLGGCRIRIVDVFRMILATAGHVDHGKTSLVRRLTGVDTDRLAEEKARGLTIDLGFAYKPLPSGTILGVVDVPGHERFVSNMLAGVGAIDCALLVVAADDGPMPQTLEHVAILDMLGVAIGAVAVTKIDCVDATRFDEALAEIRDALSGTFLEDAEVFPVSNVTGKGIAELQEHLAALAELFEPRERRGYFRLAVDRCFTIHGAGVVVTGAAFSGQLASGSRAMVAPLGSDVRVRSLRALNEPAQAGHAGERIALNLTGAGARKDAIRRGDWIVASEANHPSSRLDARLRLLATEDHALVQNRPVHFHFGAQDVAARVAVLEGNSISPGGSALVRITLDRPTMAIHGDRFILRDQSAQRTIAGGIVLDAHGPSRGRARAARVAQLRALDTGSPAEAFDNLLALPEGEVDLTWFARLFNLRPEEVEAMVEPSGVIRAGDAASSHAITLAKWERLQVDALERVAAEQMAHPDGQGISAAEIRKSIALQTSAPALSAALAQLVAAGKLQNQGQVFFLPGSRNKTQHQAGALGDLIVGALRDGGIPPPTVHELSARTALAPHLIFGFLNRAAAKGIVRRVGDRRFFLSGSVTRLAKETEELGKKSTEGWFKVSDFRERTGIGRRPAVELLEYFDKVGFTIREGDCRRVARPAAALFNR